MSMGAKWLLLLFIVLLATPGYAQTSTSNSQAIDPTKNVLDLVNAESKFQNMSREYEGRLRDAEMRRLKELAEQKERYDVGTATTLRANLEASTLLLAGSLKDLKSDLSDRVSKVERFQYETSGGKSGANELWLIIAAVVGFLIGLGGLTAAILRHRAVV